jgi:hypothetical protein
MTRWCLPKRLAPWHAGAIAAVLFAVVAIPHVHGDPVAAHHAHATEFCKLHNSFSAQPSAATFTQPALARIIIPLALVSDAPPADPAVPARSSRAPPQLS